MLIFISYPRKLQEFAEILNAELSSRKIKTFLDTENISLADPWRLTIEEAIKEADIFVVLYLSEAVEDSKGYFATELMRIESQCKDSSSAKLITVLFPPAQSENLKPYFRIHQHILGSSDKNASHQWTEKILMQIEKLNENKPNQKESKLEWHIPVLLIMLLVFLAGSGFVLSREREDLLMPPLGESVCNSLLGNYELGHEYVFNWDVNSRSIATHDTTWRATDCIFNEKEDKYTLKGIDKTYFDVETIIEGKYIRIATVPLSYDSEVHINNLDGRLIDRFFNAVISPEEVNKEDIKIYPQGKTKELAKKLSDDFIYNKTEEVLRARYEMHKRMRSTGCSPMRGYRGTRTAIAFVCAHYTRVMVKF